MTRYIDPSSGAAPQPGGYSQSQGDVDTKLTELTQAVATGQESQPEPDGSSKPENENTENTESTESGDQATQAGPDGAAPDPENDPAPGDGEQGEEEGGTATTPEEPGGNASREIWRDYALAIGATEEEVADLSRNELREKYGSDS